MKPKTRDTHDALHSGARAPSAPAETEVREGVTEHVLASGARIEIRPIRPEDAGALRDAFARLSTESRYRRFFAGVSELSDETLRYLTQVDGENHVALVATMQSLDLKEERGIGVARFIRLADAPDVAEAAVTVVDDMQHQGVGRHLLEELTRAARARGITKFRGEILASNAPMQRILEEVGAVAHPGDGETVAFDVSIEADPRGAASGARGRGREERPGEHAELPSELTHLFRVFASSAMAYLTRLLPR